MANPDPSPETRFQPGESGNPAGKPPGTFSLRRILKELFAENRDEEAKELWEAQIKKAKDGDTNAMKFIVENVDGLLTQRTEVRDLNKDFVGKVLEGLREGAKAKGIEKEMAEIMAGIEIPDEWMK